MNIYLIGVGGAGVSSLAKYYLTKGHKISGSDLNLTDDILSMEKSGLKFFLGHKDENLPKNTDLVVYSPAIQKTNPELKYALKLGIKTLSYPQALGEITKEYSTIAISGTHGKSTTTAMIATILIEANFDPTVIIGAKAPQFNNNNFRIGKSKYLIIEADEHFASFLNYSPQIIVLTNIEADHLDFYKSLNNILKTFTKYIQKLPNRGVLVVNKDDKNILKIIFDLSSKEKSPKGRQFLISNKFLIKEFSKKQKEAQKLKKVLKVPGEHNLANAMAAFTVAKALKIPEETVLKALSKFNGIGRRFEQNNIKIGNKKITIINDFAHHPTEIEATLKAAREKFPRREIWCFFQPHQYHRTKILFKDFVKTFQDSAKLINKIFVTDIYDVAGREKKINKNWINSQNITIKINKDNIEYIPKEKIAEYIQKNIKGGEAVIIMGAGDIYQILNKI